MKEDKQRKFHDALLHMLYPPPPSPPSPQEDDGKEEANDLTALLTDISEEELENEETCSLPSSGTDEKLTRAQRKRLRKRKLKEAASQRRKIIGPLLPGSEGGNEHNGDGVDVVDNEAQGVRRNAPTDVSEGGNEQIDGGVDVENNEAEGVRRNATTNISGESKNNKVKRRRKSKKLAVAKSASSITESVTSDQNQGLETH